MKCPRAVITSFANSLREKAIEIEEYIDENERPLKTKQKERLQRMTNSMEDRCHRMRAAWQEHNPNVHKKDVEFLEELHEVVKSIEAEVEETSREARKVLQPHNSGQNPERMNEGQKNEECLRAVPPRTVHRGEKLTRQQITETRKKSTTWTAEPTPKKGGLASPRTAEYHSETESREWKKFEEENNALNNRRKTKELTRGINPRGETGCGHSNQKASGKNNTEDESAGEPVKKKAKRMAAEPRDKTKNEIEGICKRMAKEYEMYTEKFEWWSKNKNHGLDENQLRDLNDKIKGLIAERDKIWKENEEIFRKETNYGLMNLRHRAAEKHLNEMSNRLQNDIEKQTEHNRDNKPPRKKKDEHQREKTPHRQEIPQRHSGSYTTCNDCGDVFSSTKILELHACDKTSSESERKKQRCHINEL